MESKFMIRFSQVNNERMQRILFNVSSTNSACDKTYLKEADDFALMLIQVNFIANKVINLTVYRLLTYRLIGY